MKLEPLMTYHADLKPPVDVGRGPAGHRMIFEVIGGHFEGPRLRGEILTGGGDWARIDEQGTVRLDVRASFRTDDGAALYVQYFGILEMNEKVQQAMAGAGATEFGDAQFLIQPRFETGDERYGWLNRTVAIAEGRLLPNAVEYRAFACLVD
jgi:hypothetical protein